MLDGDFLLFLLTRFFFAVGCSSVKKGTSLMKQGTDRVAVANFRNRELPLAAQLGALGPTGIAVGVTNFEFGSRV